MLTKRHSQFGLRGGLQPYCWRCVFVVFGCQSPGAGSRSMDSAAAAVLLPEEIDEIYVSWHRGEVRKKHHITPPNQVLRFVRFVNDRRDGWKTPWDTFPVSDYTVVASRGKKGVAVYWISPGHLGGRFDNEGAESNRLRPLSEDDWIELSEILELSQFGPEATEFQEATAP